MRHCRLNQEWLVDVNAGKTQLVLFDWSHNSGATDVTMDGPVFEENHLSRCCDCLSVLHWIGEN